MLRDAKRVPISFSDLRWLGMEKSDTHHHKGPRETREESTLAWPKNGGLQFVRGGPQTNDLSGFDSDCLQCDNHNN